jgi:FkbM family methyltransferase
MFGFLNRSREALEFEVDGKRLTFADHPGSITRESIAKELQEDAYQLKTIPFAPGDVVVDIGGHVGIMSIFIAKSYPLVKVYAFEPVPANAQLFRKNLSSNNIQNVELFESAVTGDGRSINLAGRLDKNSGGASAHTVQISPKHERWVAQSSTLKDIFDRQDIRACRLLKIDCEGSEHEILLNFPYLDRVEHMRGEFHINSTLRTQGYTIERLVQHCHKFIEPRNLSYVSCAMAE